MTVSYLLYILFGRLIIYFGMQFPPLAESRFEFVKRLFSCDLCLGGWVFTGLSFVMGESIFRDYLYVPFVSEVGTGLFTALLVHLLVLGWKAKFDILVIE
jgi:hypothetical protein